MPVMGCALEFASVCDISKRMHKQIYVFDSASGAAELFRGPAIICGFLAIIL